jgi:hypothetical protein
VLFFFLGMLGAAMQTDQNSAANAVAELFLQASLDSSRWVAALDAMASATRSFRGQLLGIDSRGELVFNFVTQIDDAFNADFIGLPSQHDPMMNYRETLRSGTHGLWSDGL